VIAWVRPARRTQWFSLKLVAAIETIPSVRFFRWSQEPALSKRAETISLETRVRYALKVAVAKAIDEKARVGIGIYAWRDRKLSSVHRTESHEPREPQQGKPALAPAQAEIDSLIVIEKEPSSDCLLTTRFLLLLPDRGAGTTPPRIPVRSLNETEPFLELLL
jgi:hypothetical protein